MAASTKAFGAVAFAGNGTTRSAGPPTATFPGAVAGGAQLVIAVDREQTRLALPLNATDTSMTVQSAAGLAIWSLLSIEDEIVQVNNPPSGNVVPIRRGFDGTTPALHLAGATVAGLIVAYHHNTLMSEIVAIESALGPNLSNLSGTQLLLNTTFQFPPQSPGGALTVGANVVTLTPVPKGVNGTDVNHYLYISGGTGSPEAAKIIGGTAVSGAASGTVIVQCANTHSGAWTIQSATAGIQEGYQTLVTAGTGGTVYISPQTNTVYTAVDVGAPNITLAGIAAGASIIKAANNANISDALIFLRNTATGFNLLNCVIDGNRDNTGINPTRLVAACIFMAAGNCQIVNCEIRFSPFEGMFIGDSTISPNNIIVNRCYIHHNGRVDGNGGSHSGFGGVGIQSGGTARPNGLRITNCKIMHNHNAVVQPGDGAGVNLDALSVVIANNFFEDNFNVGGGQIVGAVSATPGSGITDGAAGWTIAGNVIRATTTFGTPPDATDGIEIAMRDFVIANNVISGVSRYGIDLNGSGTGNGSVTGNTIFNVAQGMACLPFAGTAVDHVVFSGNSVDASTQAFATGSQHTYIAVKGNVLTAGSGGQSVTGSFGVGCQVIDNLVNHPANFPHNVTMTASPMDYTAGFTQEMVSIKSYTTLTVTYLGSGLQIANSTAANSTWTWLLNPGEVIHSTYTGTPVMTVVPLD
jgi:hypothetical protein